jgi:hypothetical protein
MGVSTDGVRKLRTLFDEIVTTKPKLRRSRGLDVRGLDGRSRDKDGTIREKRSDTKVETLREVYGKCFTPGVRGDATLGTVKEREKVSTLDDLLRKYRMHPQRQSS